MAPPLQVGDLLNGRTVRSLAYLLSMYKGDGARGWARGRGAVVWWHACCTKHCAVPWSALAALFPHSWPSLTGLQSPPPPPKPLFPHSWPSLTGFQSPTPLSASGVEVVFVAPPVVAMKDDIKDFLTSKAVKWSEVRARPGRGAACALCRPTRPARPSSGAR